MELIWIALGVALLYAGGEVLVRGAARLGAIYGLSPMTVGLTIVAFGTSSPELATSLMAAVQGATALAFGNVVGSNIANVGLILGLAALVSPMKTTAEFIRRKLPIMIAVTIAVYPVCLDLKVERWEGALLLACLIPYFIRILPSKEHRRVEEQFENRFDLALKEVGTSVAAVVVGTGLLVAGARWLVNGAVEIAESFEISERVIGLTLVAVGGSLPELASTLVAARRGQGDIALGNIVGSNIFNILAILGATALVRDIEVPAASLPSDLLWLLVMSLLPLPFLVSGLRLGRREGAVLLVLYGVYVGLLAR